MHKTALPLALGLGWFAAAACAAQSAPSAPPRGPAGMMMRADANGDGVLTRDEALAEAGARFDRMDANHDGRLDRGEMARLAEMRHGRRGPGRDDAPPPPPRPTGE